MDAICRPMCAITTLTTPIGVLYIYSIKELSFNARDLGKFDVWVASS
jgi:hypothetical protein